MDAAENTDVTEPRRFKWGTVRYGLSRPEGGAREGMHTEALNGQAVVQADVFKHPEQPRERTPYNTHLDVQIGGDEAGEGAPFDPETKQWRADIEEDLKAVREDIEDGARVEYMYQRRAEALGLKTLMRVDPVDPMAVSPDDIKPLNAELAAGQPDEPLWMYAPGYKQRIDAPVLRLGEHSAAVISKAAAIITKESGRDGKARVAQFLSELGSAVELHTGRMSETPGYGFLSEFLSGVGLDGARAADSSRMEAKIILLDPLNAAFAKTTSPNATAEAMLTALQDAAVAARRMPATAVQAHVNAQRLKAQLHVGGTYDDSLVEFTKVLQSNAGTYAALTRAHTALQKKQAAAVATQSDPGFAPRVLARVHNLNRQVDKNGAAAPNRGRGG